MIMSQNRLKTGVARVALSHCIVLLLLRWWAGLCAVICIGGWFRHVSVSYVVIRIYRTLIHDITCMTHILLSLYDPTEHCN